VQGSIIDLSSLALENKHQKVLRKAMQVLSLNVFVRQPQLQDQVAIACPATDPSFTVPPAGLANQLKEEAANTEKARIERKTYV